MNGRPTLKTLTLTAALAVAACGAAATSAGEPVARIDGQALTMAELEESLAAQLQQLDLQRRQLLEAGLSALVEERLLAAEAGRRGVSPGELLAAEAGGAAVTDAEVDAWYEANKARIPRPKEEVAEQIRAYLARERSQAAREALLTRLRAEHQVEILLEPMRVELDLAGATFKGSAQAPVTVVEFSDFQCPACRGFNPTLERVREAYGERVRIAFRQFPLTSIHPQASKAAEAALCARDQGKFWEMHDSLFARQAALAVDDLEARAQEMGLDGERFDRCLGSGEHGETVQADIERGRRAGVSGTPTVFVNGRPAGQRGTVPSFDQLAALIDDELARRGGS